MIAYFTFYTRIVVFKRSPWMAATLGCVVWETFPVAIAGCRLFSFFLRFTYSFWCFV